MIAPLRRLHRVVFAVLAILLPLLVFLALRGRHEVPVNEWLPEAPVTAPEVSE